jgi:hypothetical protein
MVKISVYLCYRLKQGQTIQKLIAGFLLLLFSISTAPKAYFHDILANHNDSSGCHQPHKKSAFHVQGYNCHFDELVVTAPFVMQADEPVHFIKFYTEQKPARYSISFFPVFLQHKENRGPPAA